jgi:hypothetical protein
MSHVSAILAAATRTIMKDGEDDIRARGERIERRNAGINNNAEASMELTEKMYGVQQEARDKAEAAADTGFFGRLSGTGKRRENEAEALNAEAVALSGDAELVDQDSEALRDLNHDDLDAMKVRQDGVHRAITFVGEYSEETGS